jgi:hypothetical protein
LSLYAKGDCGPRYPLSNVTLAGTGLPGPGQDAPGTISPGITGAGEPDPKDPRYIGGFGNCREAMRLWDLLPAGDAIVVG